MIWGLRTAGCFALALAGLLLFLWCLLAMIEAETAGGGYIWGLIIFGGVAIVAGLLALIGLMSSGGVSRARDALTDKRPSAVPRATAGRDTLGPGHRPMGSGEVPRPSAGRQIS
ncbi:hypothetical protein [Yoonia sp. BS5-3]|uniref:Uncharacterized protein n=1 Tax=Yoonia phaeophyticola TaxID=3137369 RepID=A0ABZ2V9C8_9RHOB